MLKPTDLRTGKYVIINSITYEVLKYSHKKLARGVAIVKVKLKDLENKNIIEKTLKGQEKIEEANLSYIKCQYLYKDDSDFVFMISSDFNQFNLAESLVDGKEPYLKEGEEVNVVFSKNRPIGISLPVKIGFKVIKTEPGVRGDTASSATKNAQIETGLNVQVPLFIKEGDIIKIDTRDGKYIERP